MEVVGISQPEKGFGLQSEAKSTNNLFIAKFFGRRYLQSTTPPDFREGRGVNRCLVRIHSTYL